MYKQKRYEDVFDISKEIVRIHEVIDGVEAAKTAMALGNVGAVAHRLGKKSECALAMNRALYIMIRVSRAFDAMPRNTRHFNGRRAVRQCTTVRAVHYGTTTSSAPSSCKRGPERFDQLLIKCLYLSFFWYVGVWR